MSKTWHWDRFSTCTSGFSLVIVIPPMFHTHSSTPTPYNLCNWYCSKMTHLEATTTAATVIATIIPITAITMLAQFLVYQNYYCWPHKHTHLHKCRHISVITIGTLITTSILSSLSSSSVIVAEKKLDLTLNITLFWVRLLILSNNVSCWDRCSTVVKVLFYESEGRWFDPRCCHWNFLLT